MYHLAMLNLHIRMRNIVEKSSESLQYNVNTIMSTLFTLHVKTKGQITQCTHATTRSDQLRSRRHRVNMSTRSAKTERTPKV